MNIEEKIFELALPEAEKSGFELVDVEYVREREDMYLRVYIDKKGGITIDDCQAFSEKFGKTLDDADMMPGPYIFEVSSPGLERVLKKDRDFERYCGEMIELKLYRPAEGKKVIQGVLTGFDRNSIRVETEGTARTYDRKDIAIVKRLFIFEREGK